MNPSFYYVEIFILLLLYYVGWNVPPKSVFKCSRIKSRLVRMIIHKRVLPVLHRYKLSLPLDCPFHGERDILWWPDVQYDFEDGQWICPFCGQIFSSEVAVIEHWDQEHVDFKSEDTVCLANFCDIFRCDVILAALEVEKNKFAWEKFYKYQYPVSKNSCNEKKMLYLHNKCKVLIGRCLLGLLSSLSVNEFQDVEDEISQAICSYLTCNKYSDGSLQVEKIITSSVFNKKTLLVKPVPVIIVIVVGFVLIGGFSLCYYVVYSMSCPGSFLNNELLCNGADQSGLYAQQCNSYVYQRSKNKFCYRKK